MKLRIEGNTVRIRLSKAEVEKLTTSKYIEERTSFGNIIFVCALQSKQRGKELTADFDGNKMTMFVPLALLKDWATNEVTGFEAQMKVSATESLHLLLEKDFKCLDKKPEDQSGKYDNPKDYY